jgi:phosphonate transport system substrate-binding protein
MPTVIRLADTGIDGMENLSTTFGPFATELGRLTGTRVEFFPVSDRTAAITALQFRQLDLVLAGPSEYIMLRNRLRVPPKPVAGIARDRYATAFIVQADSPFQTIADLRGRRIAMKDPGSTTGHLIPFVMLREAGLDPDRDVTVRLLDGARIEALVNGDVDALASGLRDYDQLVRRFGEGRYRIIAESPTIPADVFIVRGDLPEEFQNKLKAVFKDHADTLLPLLQVGTNQERYRAGIRLVAADDSDYDVIREGYRLIGMNVQ